MDRKEGSSFSPLIETPGGSSNLHENKENNLGELISDEALDALDEYLDLLIISKGEARVQRKRILKEIPEEEREELESLMDFSHELYSKCRRAKLQPPPARLLPIKSLEKAS